MLQQRIEAFNGLMVDMKTDQRLRLAYNPGTGIRLDVDGTVKGTIEGDDFSSVRHDKCGTPTVVR